ncbi:MAG TPA: hypothetical protein VHC20_00805 [Candidatus Paceibacterota bacterium]|nr:hypothetical protein [Candidatus Paceibacterota bacterium]
MGSRNPERDRLYASGRDRLHRYIEEYTLTAICRRCGHRRDLHIELMLKVCGQQATLAQVAARLRCHQCGLREPRLQAYYRGPRRRPER